MANRALAAFTEHWRWGHYFSSLVQKAKALMPNVDGPVSLSTYLPTEAFLREEEMYWEGYDGPSFKKLLNEYLLDGRDYSRSRGRRIHLDLINGRAWIEEKPRFIFGRYRKLRRFVYQSREPPSVFHILKTAVEDLGGRDVKLHASGREDYDARMLGRGRPFVLRLRGDVDLFLLERRVNAEGIIAISDLRWVGQGSVELVTASHFYKYYKAGVFCEDPPADIARLNGLITEIAQRTPLRVMRRRSDLIRRKRVHAIKYHKLDEHRFLLWVKTDPGLYIKELISGDQGRTQPSVSELLNTQCYCYFLDVLGMDDAVLDFLLQTFKDASA